MVSTRSATAVTSEGFTLLRKRSSEGAPTLTPLPKAERRPRAERVGVLWVFVVRVGGRVLRIVRRVVAVVLARAAEERHFVLHHPSYEW